MKYNQWTTKEVELLGELYEAGAPEETIAESLPRHPVGSSMKTAHAYGFRRPSRILRAIKGHVFRTGYRWEQ